MNDDGLTAMLVAGIIIGASISWLITLNVTNAGCEAEAIEHNAAQYNSATGKFEWLKEPSK